MSNAAPLLRFLPVAHKSAPAKAHLRAEVDRSVRRSQQLLPALGLENPGAALLVERQIDDWMEPTTPPLGTPHDAPDRRYVLPARTRTRAADVALALACGVAPTDLDDGPQRSPVRHRPIARPRNL